MASNGCDPQMDNSTNVKSEPSQDDNSSGSNNAHIFTKAENQKKLVEFADNAAEELHRMASLGSPLWKHDDLGVLEYLDKKVYKDIFGPNIARREELSVEIISRALDWPAEYPIPSLMSDTPAQRLKTTGSRARETVLKNPIELVNMFMDVKQWMAMFSNIVSSTTLLGKILEDGNPDGSLIAMKAEFGFPSPIYTRRETYFLRRSRKVNDRIWLIVDASLDIPCLKCYRKPSGCLIEQMDDGFSRITWVEHNELSRVNGYLYGTFGKHVSSGSAFCVSRWITTLKHQAGNQFIINQQINAQGGTAWRSSLVRIAHRMSQIWMSYMNANSTNKTWNLIPNYMENPAPVYVLKDNFENNRGRMDDSVMTVATIVRLPYTSEKLYHSLRCAECSTKWDIIPYAGGFSKKELYIPMGNDQPTGVISVLHVEIPGSMEPLKRLQAIFTDSIGMYIVWTYLDPTTYNGIMDGNIDSDRVKILVSGASVLRWDQNVESGGSILTVSFEMLKEGPATLCVQLIDTFNVIMNHTIAAVNFLCTQLHEDEQG